MGERTSVDRADDLSGDAQSQQELSAEDVGRECGSVLPERALMRKKLPGRTFSIDWSAYDPQQAAADPFYVPKGTFGLP